MRGNKNEVTGAIGETEVKLAFERLGWGVAATDVKRDVGTDLILQARDSRMFDQGDFMAAQVKSGPSSFREPGKDEQGRPGWWYREADDEHFDYWVNHGLPHLLILHNLETHISYWVHVVADAVVSTGKGNKIFVPTDQTVDGDHASDLLAAAASSRPKIPLEGSSWLGATALRARDRGRHAMIAPRLVAPHPNRGAEAPITPEEAVALLVQARLTDYNTFAERHDSVPTLDEARASKDWRWRFVAALGDRLLTGKAESMAELVAAEPKPGVLVPDEAWWTMAVVAVAASLLEEGRAAEAEQLLTRAVDRDGAEPVDHAWLLVQRARALVELERIEDARADADAVQHVRISHPDDVTAGAIAGVGAAILFNTAGRSLDIAGFITSTDTAAAWWRNQTKADGLTQLTHRLFRDWARDTATVSGETDNDVLSVVVCASFLGDHTAWSHGASLLGRTRLLNLGRRSKSDEVLSALQILQEAGDTKSLKLAIKRVCEDGPAEAVTALASSIDLDSATPTVLQGDLAVLHAGSDVLEEHVADAAVAWLLAHELSHSRLEVLAAVVPTSSPASWRRVLNHMLQMPDVEHFAYGQVWARVVRALPERAWTPDDLRTATERADRQEGNLLRAYQAMTAPHDPQILDRLIHNATDGVLPALTALAAFWKIPAGNVPAIVSHLRDRLNQQMRDADKGKFVGYLQDGAELLVLIHFAHPDQADWSILGQFLAHPRVLPQDKGRALHQLAQYPHLLSSDAKASLEPAVQAFAELPRSTPLPWFGPDPSAAAVQLLPLLREPRESDRQALLQLLSGDANERQWAARAAGHLPQFPESAGILIALSHDDNPNVRAVAAAQLAYLAADSSVPSSFDRLNHCLNDPGTLVPAAVAQTLTSFPSDNAIADQALSRLASHRSARVREVARRNRN